MYTGSYKNNNKLNKSCSISGDRGKGADYEGFCYPTLAPKLSFWKIWHDNIGKISEEENNYFYISEYYKQVLSKLNIDEVYNELEFYTLLCYEDSEQFCHRHIVAAWFELILGVEVPEIKTSEKERPNYIKEYLERIIKENLNMKGFNSLKALYLFEKGNELDAKAEKLEKETGVSQDRLWQAACYYRSEADFEEDNYNERKKVKIKK